MLQLRLHQGITILNDEIMTMETSIMGNKTNFSLLIPHSLIQNEKKNRINNKYLIAKQFSLTINHASVVPKNLGMGD